MDTEEPKQLKLTNRTDGGVTKEKKEKKEKEPKASKWVVVTILVITVAVSLVFYFSGRRRRPIEQQPAGSQNQESPLGGQKVYQF